MKYKSYLPRNLLVKGGSASLIHFIGAVRLTGNFIQDNKMIRDWIIRMSENHDISAIDYENILCKLWVGYFKY